MNVSREMLMLTFTHFAVLPEFIPFLLPFGFQSYKQDFHFSGFCQRTLLHLPDEPENGRNAGGRREPNACLRKSLNICFNLRAVELESTKWSIRHCAVHHSFDLEEVQARWVIVKGNELMKERVESATGDEGLYGASDFQSLGRAFEASLKVLLMICHWSVEQWRWYINSLEDTFQNMTRTTFSAPLHISSPLPADAENFTMKSRTNTQLTESSFFTFPRSKSQTMEMKSPTMSTKLNLSKPRTYRNPDTGVSQPLPLGEDDEDDADESKIPPKPKDDKSDDENQEFSFSKLRKVHMIAEPVNEALLVLKQNIVVMAQLRNYYTSVSRRKDFPQHLRDTCSDVVADFELRLEGLENDMQTQILRLETLLRLLDDRKTLVIQLLIAADRCKLK